LKSRLFQCLLWAAIFVLIELPAQPCGPDWPEAIFVKAHGPDVPYSAFAGGRLGVPQSGYRIRHLVIAYRYLSGLPLASQEQTAAVRANDHMISNWPADQQSATAQHPGFAAWIDARKSFGAVDGLIPQNTFLTQDAWQFDSYFENCLDDAFSNAAHTLQARGASYGHTSSGVVEWVRGQDAVFQNCEKPQATPKDLPASAPQWLRYDRAYQQAATLLYRQDYDAAITAFSAIASDAPSPWSTLARYLVGRIMVARAVALESYYPPLNADPKNVRPPQQRLSDYINQLQSARKELLAMRSEPRMQPLLHAIDAMIDRVNARLEPGLQARTLAVRLSASTPDSNFYQDILDLNYLLDGNLESVNDDALTKLPHPAVPPPASGAERRAADMLAWIKAFQTGDQQTILQHWNASHTTAWLLAALTFAKTNDPQTAELLAAATRIPADDPAYTAVTYQRLRLLPGPTSRTQLIAVLPLIAHGETPSTRNLFSELNARSAPDFNSWLRVAGRKPAAEAVDSEENEFDNTPVPQPCGPALRPADTPLFAPDVATILNTHMPLRLLAAAARSNTLAPNLRFQVAQAAWTRAVLLNRHDIAARLSPILIRCNVKWQPVLSAYDAAASPEDRKAAALFALMRFASTEPNVREGNSRVDGFATYSLYRDNWWCYTVPPAAQPAAPSAQQPEYTIIGFTSFAHSDVPDPPFLTARNRAQAAREIATLSSIPLASDFLPAEAIAWQRAHPDDPRAPELLGQAFRLVRNACTDKTSSDTEHQLFLILHRRYPTNHWTTRYRSWD
jgi:hypothetical protein